MQVLAVLCNPTMPHSGTIIFSFQALDHLIGELGAQGLEHVLVRVPQLSEETCVGNAGLGLPSLLSAAMRAKAVTLTDYDPKVLRS